VAHSLTVSDRTGTAVDLRDYVRVLRKRWRLIAACTLVAMVSAALVTILTPRTYAAEVQLFVAAQDQNSVSTAYQGGLFSQQRVKSYADIVNSPPVMSAVIAQLGLSATEQRLAGQVSASAPLDTVLINITAKDGSAQRAQSIANATGTQFAQFVTGIERTNPAAPPPVKVTVVKPASLPKAPVSPRRSLNLALGLLVGLAIGVGGAVLRETLDTSVKPGDDLMHDFGLPAVGVIGFDPEARNQPLILHDQAHSSRGEAFRQLRTNLQFIDVDTPPRSIVVTSSVPEEGKTTTTMNLAVTMAEAGLRVLVVDGDLRRPQLANFFGLESAVGLTSVLIGQVQVDDVLQEWGGGLLRVLPSGPVPPNPSELLGSRGMHALLRQLEDMADLVIIDAPPVLPVTDATVLSAAASGALLVVHAGRTRREQVRRSLANLEAVDARVLGIVFNKVPTRGPDAYYDYGYSYKYDGTGDNRSVANGQRRASAKDPVSVPAGTPSDAAASPTVHAPTAANGSS
jgi:capsular exopolysaccharide synthesis family protein